ncbi:intermembrane transport protein PqiB [Reyranella sp.]|jgi:paraquat-inducible protein B|uniref:PqiB family protein n=1 Tax=Reyranella sp. TaxID=1929291 RepID=UPI002F9467DB
MDTHQEAVAVPTAAKRPARRIPLVWIVPVVTALIGAWLAWDTFSKRGPTITISFESAGGLQPGQSQLKFKDVTMGTVKSIAVTPDFSQVLVTVETTREAEPLLSDKTIFWVVKPQLFAGRISGLDTLLSGSYIGMLPSTEKGKAQRHFVGSANPPVLPVSAPGTVFKLETSSVGSISLGSPIFYRDIEVGTVLGWELGHMARNVTVHAFVREPFDKYVHDDSLFWNASGLSLKMGPSGIQLQMESVRAVLLGGIAFDTKPDTKAPVSAADHSFPLYPSHDAAKTAGFGRRLSMMSTFEGSVSGLEVGADVTLHGLKIGEVTDVGLAYDPKSDRIVVPVHYRIEGERIAGVASAEQAANVPLGTIAAEMVKRGFRATLQSTSLITGQKVVAIEQVPDAPPAELGREGDVFVIPSTQTGGFDAITRSAAELLSKINRIDFQAIGRSLSATLKGVDETVNGPQMRKTLASLEATMADLQNIARKLDTDASPALARLPDIANKLDSALAQANRLVTSMNSAYGSDSRFSREMDRLLPQLNETARSLRALTDLLARHPEALIRGRTNTGKE